MMKDISKYLFKSDDRKVNMELLEDVESIKSHLESLQLSISGLVNKLTAFTAALSFHNGQSTSLAQLKEYQAQKASAKYAALKRKTPEVG